MVANLCAHLFPLSLCNFSLSLSLSLSLECDTEHQCILIPRIQPMRREMRWKIVDVVPPSSRRGEREWGDPPLNDGKALTSYTLISIPAPLLSQQGLSIELGAADKSRMKIPSIHPSFPFVVWSMLLRFIWQMNTREFFITSTPFSLSFLFLPQKHFFRLSAFPFPTLPLFPFFIAWTKWRAFVSPSHSISGSGLGGGLFVSITTHNMLRTHTES